MYQNTKRHEFRQIFGEVFQKINQNLPLTPMEAQIAEVIELHPEYHATLGSDKSLDQDYTPEMGQSNPFLHMALHLSIRDQIRLNRPTGVTPLFQKLCRQTPEHAAEHFFIECLAEVLHEAQRNNQAPNEEDYLRKIREAM
jgi:hypothetical protein